MVPNGPNTGVRMSDQKMPTVNGQLSRHQNMPPPGGLYPLQQLPKQGVANYLNQPLQRPPTSSNGADVYFDQETGRWATPGPPQQDQGPPLPGNFI